MPQTELHPVPGACRHMRGRYRLQPSHKSPFPERRLQRYECERGHEIDNESEEEVDKCFRQITGCWKEGDTGPEHVRPPQAEGESSSSA